MKKKRLFLALGIILILALSCVTIIVKGGWKTMRINVAKVEYIEYSMGFDISDIKITNDIPALVDFLNSFTLTKRYENIDCQRPSTNIIIYYKDGSTEHIEYRYTSLVYRGKGYEIDINKTDELDRLLFPQAWFAREPNQ